MFKYAETGHPKNVANFKTLISFCEGYASSYNPGMESLSIASLNSLYTSANAVVDDVRNSKANEQLMVNQRAVAFEPVMDILKRAIRFLEACGASEETVRNAKSIISHVQGRRKSKKTTEENKDTSEPENNPAPDKKEEEFVQSHSHTSFDSRIDAVKHIVQILMTQVKYQPKEQEITLESLISLGNALENLNNQAKAAMVQVSNTRVVRDNVLYLNESNLVDTATNVKKYIYAAFGKNSTQYKQVSKLLFVYMPSMI